MRRRILALIAVLPALAWAADVWEAKPFEEWTSKDLQKVVTNSPWARQTRALVSGPASAEREVTGIGDARSGNPEGGGPQRAGSASSAGGAERLGAVPSDVDFSGAASQQAGIPVIVRWQSALPLRQAQIRAKYGKEAATSPEAQKYLTQEPMLYVLVVSGLQGSMVSGGAGDEAKRKIMLATRLTTKGNQSMRPAVVDFAANGTAVDVLIGFPRSVPLTLEDQDADFSTQIGPARIAYKFKLKDMLLHGKLEL